MNKRILIVSDSPFLTTGFGVLSKRIGEYLYNTKGIEVAHCGISDPRKNDSNVYNTIKIPWTVYKYNNNYQEILSKFKPDGVIVISDLWNAGSFNNTRATTIFLSHIEGKPLPRYLLKGGKPVNIIKSLVKYDYIVPAGDFAKETLIHRLKKYLSPQQLDSKLLKPIPDCVDINNFKKQEGGWKSNLLGVSDKFLVGWFGRQNGRKGLPYVLKAFKKWNNPDARLYLHTAIKDHAGWDLMQMIEDLDIEDEVILNKMLRVGKGVKKDMLCKLYNACDITVQPSLGEGFGGCIADSLACGNPVVINNYSELQRFEDVCYSIEPKAYYVEPRSNIERAIPDIDEIVKAMDSLYKNPKLREYYSDKGQDFIKKFSIDNVGKQWENVIKENVEEPNIKSDQSDLISIIVPTYNCEEYIDDFIYSVENQTYQNYEIIIVDDGSTDNSQKVLEKHKEKNYIDVITCDKNRNANYGRMVGYKQSKGDYVIFADMDSKWEHNMLEEMYITLIRNEDVSYVYSNHYRKGLINDEWTTGKFNPEHMKKLNQANMNSLFKREDFPGLDLSLKRGQDWDLWLTMLQEGNKGKHIPKFLYTQYVREEGLTGQGNKDWNKWRKEVLNKHSDNIKEDLVSIIVPVYNCEDYIEDFVNSVNSQTYENYEVIFVDDGSTDDSLKEIYDNSHKLNCNYRIISYGENKNANCARIKGYNISHGEYIIFADVDSKWNKNLLKEYVRSLKRNEDVSYVYSDHKRRGFVNDTWRSMSFNPKMLKKTNFIHMTSLIRREDYEKTEGLDP